MERGTIMVTGAAGFIGYHLSETLLKDGWQVVGVDSLSDYYDRRIKHKRLALLREYPGFKHRTLDLAEYKPVESLMKKERPVEIVHLAAQAGVRYSLSNPWAYANSNYLGALNVFEAAKRLSIPRVAYASSSSVYGANKKQPFSEVDSVDVPLSVYAATKRANELLAFTYTHLYGMETVGLRFFTAYGPWGRPDLALFKFARRISLGQPIDVYNHGNMKRNFTYIDDVTTALARLPKKKPKGRAVIYNLGGAEAVPLMRFIELLEAELGQKAEKNFLPLQAGDVPETIADCSLAAKELGFKPKVSIEEGIRRFVAWFKENEKFVLSLSEPKQ